MSLEQFRAFNKKTLEMLNIPPQWEHTTGKGVKVILATSGTHGERVLRVINAIAPDVVQVYKARDTADAIRYAKENGVKLINFSKYEQATPERVAALDNLPDDIVFVAASGNWVGEVTFPASHQNAIAVANYNAHTGRMSSSSNVGPEVDMAAPGHWQYGASGAEFYGTSYAAPVVTASISIIQAVFHARTGRWPTRTEVLEIMDDDFFRDIAPGVERDGKGLLVFPDPEDWIPEIVAMAEEEPKENQGVTEMSTTVFGTGGIHFKEHEFRCKCGCGKAVISTKLIGLLEAIRAAAGHKPVIITSGYRCEAHNKAVGGAKDSQHCKGTAADIVINGLLAGEIAKVAEQCGADGIGVYTKQGFCHVDVRGTSKAKWFE